MTRAEANELGQWYISTPEHSYTYAHQRAIQAFVEQRFDHITRDLGVGVVYVSGQPYGNAYDMREFLQANGYLQISTDYNVEHGTHVLTPRHNLMFRLVHDYDHCQTGDCNFNLLGEICAYGEFARETPNAKIRNWLFAEIVGQVSALGFTGDFPAQKYLEADNIWPNKIAQAYGYK